MYEYNAQVHWEENRLTFSPFSLSDHPDLSRCAHTKRQAHQTLIQHCLNACDSCEKQCSEENWRIQITNDYKKPINRVRPSTCVSSRSFRWRFHFHRATVTTILSRRSSRRREIYKTSTRTTELVPHHQFGSQVRQELSKRNEKRGVHQPYKKSIACKWRRKQWHCRWPIKGKEWKPFHSTGEGTQPRIRCQTSNRPG